MPKTTNNEHASETVSETAADSSQGSDTQMVCSHLCNFRPGGHNNTDHSSLFLVMKMEALPPRHHQFQS